MSVKIYSPEGPIGSTAVEPAPRPSTLSGLRIALLDNRKSNADVILDRVAWRLQERTGATVTLKVAKSSSGVGAPTAILSDIKRRADLALTGTAD